MKHFFYIIVTALLISSCTNQQPTLYMIGDSTMANKPDLEFPERGWGQLLPQFFDPTFVVDNHSRNGRSTRSFIYESRWDTVYSKLKTGDFVVIQFGHNDDVITKSKTYTTHKEFAYNLTRYVKDTRKQGAIPILCTPIIRRNYVEGILTPTHSEYPDIIKEVAQENNVPLIDMTALSRELVLKLGEEASKDLYLHLPANTYKKCIDGRIDNTHFSEIGATNMAALFVNEIKNQNIDLAKYLSNEKN